METTNVKTSELARIYENLSRIQDLALRTSGVDAAGAEILREIQGSVIIAKENLGRLI